MALERQSRNTRQKIKAWLKRCDPEPLILHSRFDRDERKRWSKRMVEVKR